MNTISKILLLTLPVAAIAATMPDISPRQPQLAAAHGTVAMTYGAGSTVYFRSSTDQGATFGPPVRVRQAGSLALGRHRGPRIAILKDAIVISAVVGEPKVQAGTLTAWRSTDNGKSWTQGKAINDVPEAAREGLHAMIARPDGSLFAVWLDLRVKGTHLVGSTSTDGGLSWSKNTLVYESPSGTIFQCCHPSLAVDSKGDVWVMWRNAVDGSRDLYAASSADGVHFTAARKLGAGTWKLDACPMDGGGFAVDAAGKITSAWRRDSQIYLSSGDAAETLVGNGKDVALIAGKDGPHLAWTKEGAVQVLLPGMRAPKAVTVEGGFPSLIALDNGSVLLAWETHTSIETLLLR